MAVVILFFQETLKLWLDISPYLLLGCLMAGLLHVFLGKDFVSRHLGKGGFLSILKATLMGVPLPVCSCGVIPLASSLENNKAHKSSVLAFLVSTPTSGVDSMFATYSLMGPLFAIFRPLAAIILGLVTGATDYIFRGKKKNRSHNMPPWPKGSRPFKFRFKEVLKYSFYDVPGDIGKWLIVGTLVGGAISALLPKDILANYFMPPLDFLAAVAIGVPLYVCATGSIPVAVSLIQKGFSPGAGLVFLIVGPATNAIALSFVRAKFGKRSFYLYLATITLVALGLGWVFNYIWVYLGSNSRLITGAGQMLPEQVKIISALLLTGMVFNPFRMRRSLFQPDLVLKVPDIKCQECKNTLELKISQVSGVDKVWVDIAKKTISIKGKADKDVVIDKIKEVGYTPLTS